MLANKPQGFIGRTCTAIRRVILGRSDPSYLAKLVGDEKFIDEAIAAQLSCSGVESQREPASLDPVDEAFEESFPASDPPAQSAISTIGPPHREKPAA
jgi:hypothetical protein